MRNKDSNQKIFKKRNNCIAGATNDNWLNKKRKVHRRKVRKHKLFKDFNFTEV